MRAVVQRVSDARVSVGDDVIGSIGRGALTFVGVGHGDDERTVARMAKKVCELRIFADEAGKMNLSLLEIPDPAVLAVSQFTLYADVSRGRRPSFVKAAPPEVAAPLFSLFCEEVRSQGVRVEEGRFGAMMKVSLVNDGPVTILIDV